VSTVTSVICRPALAPGFALAGIVSWPATTAEETGQALAAQQSRANVGVVLVEEVLYDELAEDTRARLERWTRPVIVPFPGPSWTEIASAEARVVELLRRAIGYRVRLR
jgi:vacuolar-type H+-ATPase subunit F/Vma7